MPVTRVRKGGIVYYRWGQSGKLYRTKAKALRQGRAIKISQNRRKNDSRKNKKNRN